MRKITRAEWNAKHPDYKGRMADGRLSMLALDPATGATVLEVVEIVDERPARRARETKPQRIALASKDA